MSVCQATRCKRRDECMRYENNYFKYHPKAGWMQLIDWSTYGSAGYSQDLEGNIYMQQDYTCGDNTYLYPTPYPLFDNILSSEYNKETDYIKWQQWLNQWDVQYKEVQLSPSPKIVKLMIGGAYGYAAIYFKDNKFMYIDACD